MTANEKESAVLDPAVGAAADEPISNDCTAILSHSDSEFNPEFNDFEENSKLERQLARINDPAYMHTMTLNEVLDSHFEPIPYVVDGMLTVGLYILAGEPKLGKSYLACQIAYHVSSGIPLWNINVHSGTVLYFYLEGGFRQIKVRMFRMFGEKGNDNLHFVTAAKSLKDGLSDQIKLFLHDHPDTNLIIIDTLQKVRDTSAHYSYSDDYAFIGHLKELADANNICIVLLHHTKKGSTENRFEMISGTTGLLGSADGALLLYRARLSKATTILETNGRDLEDQKIQLSRDKVRLSWNFDHALTEQLDEPPDPILDALNALVQLQWTGTATELANVIGVEMPPNSLSRYLSASHERLLSEYSIEYSYKRTSCSRFIILTRRADDCDESDDCDDSDNYDAPKKD